MSDLAMDYAQIMQEEARLIILKALGEQTNESLNSSILEPVLAQFAIHMPRAWVHACMQRRQTWRRMKSGSAVCWPRI